MHLSEKVNIASVTFALLGVILCILLNLKDLNSIRLETIITFAMASSAIPMGIILVFSGFYPTLLQELNGLNIYYSLAGLSLLFVSIKTFFT